MAVISIPTSFSGISLPGSLSQVANGPLSALYAGVGVDTYRYPLDLATSSTKSHYVQFLVKEVIPTSYTGSTTGAIKGASVGVPNLGSAAQDAAKSVSDATSNIGNEIDSLTGSKTASQTTQTLSDGINTVGTTINNVVSQGIQISPTTTQSSAVISLYMPDTLTAQYASTYDDMSLNDIGSAFTTLRAINQIAGKNVDTSGSSFLDKAKNTLKSVGNIMSTEPAVITLLSKAGDFFGAQNIGINASALGDVLLKGEGYALNPQLQMIYRGIGLRSFQLAFTFTPRSASEAAEVDNIITRFKYHFSPSLQAGSTTSTDSMYLVQPSIFNITFNINGAENRYLPKYGDCVLTDIDVNYAPNGWSSHSDGAPVQTQLTLQFKETEILTRNKLMNGINGTEGGLR